MRPVTRSERFWVGMAMLIILIGVVVGLLYQLDYVPLWASTMSTILMAAGALAAALIAARSNRNENNG